MKGSRVLESLAALEERDIERPDLCRIPDSGLLDPSDLDPITLLQSIILGLGMTLGGLKP